MNKLICCFLFFSFLISIEAQSLSRTIGQCTAADFGMKCYDCTNLMFCSGATKISTIPCNSQYPGRPFCNSTDNSCVARMPACSSAFNCPSAGLFSNPDNCSTYFYCETAGPGAEIRDCLFTSVFNEFQQACVSNQPCLNLTRDCSGSFKALPYIPDDKKFVLCMGADAPMIKDCPTGMAFNVSSLRCEFQCPDNKEGFFPHPTNKQLFYTCVKRNNILVRVENDCGSGKEYKTDTKTCQKIVVGGPGP